MSYKLIDIEQNSPEWEALRRTKVGASDIAILMTGTEREIQDLWDEKVLGKRKYVTKAMQHGIDTEAEAREFASKLFVYYFQKSCAVSEKHEWLMASLDGFDSRRNVSLEIKCPSELPQTLEEYQGYKRAWWQIQAHHAVYCPDCAFLVVYKDGDSLWEQVERDEKAIEDLLKKGKWFYDLTQSMTPPSTISLRDDEDWKEAVQSWIDANTAFMAAQEHLDMCREGLIYLAGEKSARGFGVTVSKFFRKGAVEYAKIPQLAGVDLDLYRKPPLELWKVSAS